MSKKEKEIKQQVEKEHVKIHDHSFLGKHNKKQKRKYYEDLKKKEEAESSKS